MTREEWNAIKDPDVTLGFESWEERFDTRPGPVKKLSDGTLEVTEVIKIGTIIEQVNRGPRTFSFNKRTNPSKKIVDGKLQCSKCKKTKDADKDFAVDLSTGSGRNYQCKECLAGKTSKRKSAYIKRKS